MQTAEEKLSIIARANEIVEASNHENLLAYAAEELCWNPQDYRGIRLARQDMSDDQQAVVDALVIMGELHKLQSHQLQSGEDTDCLLAGFNTNIIESVKTMQLRQQHEAARAISDRTEAGFEEELNTVKRAQEIAQAAGEDLIGYAATQLKWQPLPQTEHVSDSSAGRFYLEAERLSDDQRTVLTTLQSLGITYMGNVFDYRHDIANEELSTAIVAHREADGPDAAAVTGAPNIETDRETGVTRT